jgi:hypothetical protein
MDDKEFKALSLTEKASLLQKEYPLQRLLRPDLGDLSFDRAAGDIATLCSLTQQISEVDSERLPAPVLGNLDATLVEIRKTCMAITSFSSSANYGGPTVQFRDSLVQDLATNLTRWITEAAPLVAYARRRVDPQYERSQLAGVIQEMNSFANNARANVEASEAELREIVSASREAAGSVAVSATAEFFAAESQGYQRGRITWLCATIVVAVAIGVVLWYSYNGFATALSTLSLATSIQLAFAKIAVFTVAYYVLLLCGRNFFAASHNEAVNKRKATALKTFNAFVQASHDPATKDAVLTTTTQAIFASDLSGYLFREPERSSGGLQLLEILRSQSGHQQ